MKPYQLGMYAFVHFLVDFCCASLMFQILYGKTDWYFYILLYNFCAFAMQMPIGLIADAVNRNHLVAAVGCFLVVLALGMGTFPMAATVVAGTGNALFHIGGGIEVLNVSERKSSWLGIFISPGAFGVYFGKILGKMGVLWIWLLMIALFMGGAAIFILGGGVRHTSGNLPAAFPEHISGSMIISIVCLFSVVVLRSFTGMAQQFPWSSRLAWGICLTCAVVFGKTAGGFAADRLGSVKASVVSLSLAGICYLLSGHGFWGMTAVFLFNMTMPVTLWAIAKIFPGCKGFSFGMLTFALFLGFLPAYMKNGIFLDEKGLALMAFVSLGLLSAGLFCAGLQAAGRIKPLRTHAERRK